ncbi:hypothetical protein YB2330_002960 [Saitoella coloradoensis]
MEAPPVDPAIFSELGDLESQFSTAELQLLKEQSRIFEPLYAKRDKIIARIPGFWPTVLEQIEEDCLTDNIDFDDVDLLRNLKALSVKRDKDEPRTLTLTFEFEENEFLGEKSCRIVKRFTYTEGEEGEAGEEGGVLTSKKVNLEWKDGKDLTKNAGSFFHFFSWTGNGKDKCPGEELAMLIAEDMYPNALKYYTEAVNEDEEDFDDEEGLEDDEEEEAEDEDADVKEDEEAEQEQEQPKKKKARTA